MQLWENRVDINKIRLVTLSIAHENADYLHRLQAYHFLVTFYLGGFFNAFDLRADVWPALCDIFKKGWWYGRQPTFCSDYMLVCFMQMHLREQRRQEKRLEGLGMKCGEKYSLIIIETQNKKGMKWIFSSESGRWSFFSFSVANSAVSKVIVIIFVLHWDVL